MVRASLDALAMRRSVIAALVLGCAPLASACAADSPASAHHVNVVAGENVWGSIATQLGGGHVSVVSVLTNPNADPHEYASSSADARAFAEADLVILNGAGYDDWGAKLVDANPTPERSVVTVASLLGRRAGDNPHFWYDPAAVETVADRITAEYRRIDPGDAAEFAALRQRFEQALSPYHARIAAIRSADAGRRIGATEDVFAYMASALGLDVVSPPAFMQAVAQGNDPPADSVAQFQDQVTGHGIAVLVFNVQTQTPITGTIRQLAASEGIPVVGVSETLQPAGTTFQDWQVAQLGALQGALGG